MPRLPRSIVLSGLIACSLVLHAQHGLRFIGNKGQWPDAVTHHGEVSGAHLWFERGALLLDLHDAAAMAGHHGRAPDDGPASDVVRRHAVRMRFISAGEGTHNTGRLPVATRYHWFLGNDPARWASDTRAHTQLVMHDVAPGCDAVFREGRAGLKYDLVLAPGADPAAIRITYDGADHVALRNGALLVGTSLGRMTERIPLAYQEVDGERVPVSCTYTLHKGVVGLRPGRYDPALPLVIDPELSFATYTGSVSNNFGYTATFDKSGHLYAGSTAFGAQYPTTTGAYQTSWAGGTTDIAISKFDTTGSAMVWSTFIGGSAPEMPHSIIVDDDDRLHLLGTTGSNNYPVTVGAFDAGFGGGTPFTPAGLGVSYQAGADMVVSKFSADGGQLLGSTYLGGSANDGLNSDNDLRYNYADEARGEVFLGDDGSVWVVSCTRSVDLPITANAAQGLFGGGGQDGYVARFSPDLTTLLYASYLGGAGADALYTGALDASGRLFVCGGTRSSDLPTTPGAVQPAFAGGAADALVARIGTGGALEALTYRGSSAYDQAYFVELDGDGAAYLFGQTAAPAGELIVNAALQVPAGGQFITKLTPDLDQVLLSTRVGTGNGGPDISPTAFLVDVCDKIYISGWGSTLGMGAALSTAGLPVTPDAAQATTDGHDLYLAVYDIDMSALEYATYYGGTQSREHVDGGTSRFDRRGRVYQTVCAGCQGNSDFPTSPGALSSTNNSSGCNAAVLKFDFNAPVTIAAFDAPDTVCATLAVPFTNLSGGAASYLWDFGDGQTSTAPAPVHTYAQPGTYTVTLTAAHPESCNGSDTVTGTVFVDLAPPVLQVMNDTLICGPVDAFDLHATAFGTATAWTWATDPAFTDVLASGPTDSTLTMAPAVGGTFHVMAGNGSVCTVRDSVTVTVSLAAPMIVGDTLLCADQGGMLALLGVDPGSTVLWSPGDEVLAGQGTAQIAVAPSGTMAFAAAVTSPVGCTWTGIATVHVSTMSSASVAAFVDQPIVVPGTTVQLGFSPADAPVIAWAPPGAVSNPASPHPTATVHATTTFTVTASDGICTAQASVSVTVHELVCGEPDVFVPNSFTPNGDGMNDVLLVRGRHITELEFMVFDRWGGKVFETREQGAGWDGTVNGQDVDPGVFVYHLSVRCADGQDHFTKGNVTVIR
ncbi:MAG: gliding motility-associated C-terminal domain-containing protein [Flavobacteriales bacterium]|jgi:gliding motility-associated-like protein|nr:gliding motility-associated C-terminal domain-containing protein [Flavobacteriales bacterium]